MNGLNFEWLIFVILSLIGGLTKYLTSVTQSNNFSWFMCFVESLTAVTIGLVLYFIGKSFKIDTSLLCALCVLAGMWGMPMLKHIIRTYTKIPIPD